MPNVAASWWAGMQAPCSRRPSPGAGYDLRIDTGEVIGSGLYWNHSLAHLSCFPGAGPGTPSERPGPACGGPAQPEPEALGAGGRGSRMRPHDVSGACGNVPPPRRPHPAGVRASGQRAATPPAAIGSRPARELFATPSAGYSSAPFREPVPPWKCRHPRKAQKSRPGEQFRHPSAGCSSTPVSRVGAAEDMRAAGKTLDAVGPGNGSPPPSAGCSFRLGTDVEFPPAVLGFSRTDQVPDSVTLISIGRQRVPIHRGAMMPRSCSSI